jgi:ankyrin repeat protein
MLEYNVELRAIDNENGKWYNDYAKEKGNSEIISLLQKRDDEIASSIRSQVESHDRRQLLKAVEDKDIASAQKLLTTGGPWSKGVDVNSVRDVEGRSLLSIACKNEDFEMVKQLIEAGADVNAKSNMDKTPLIYAASRGIYKIVELLLEKGADVRAVDKETGQSALYFARFRSHDKVADLLEQHLAETKPPLPSPKPALAEKGKLNTQLLKAAAEGKLELVEKLLENGANINARRADGSTPLISALYCSHPKCSKLLIEKGSDINAKDNVDWTPLLNAIDSNLTEVALILIEKGADINAQSKDGKTPLLIARQKKNKEIISRLLENEAEEPPKPELEPHEQESLNNRLYQTVSNGPLEVAKSLLEEGANPNAKYESGTTLLLRSIEHRQLDIAKLLIEKGADVNVEFSDAVTPLMIFLNQNRPDLAKVAVDHGADVNAHDKYNFTPLTYALQFSTTEIADYLIQKGAKGTLPRIQLFLRKRKRAALLLTLLATVSAGAFYQKDIENFIVSNTQQKPVAQKEDKSWLIKIKLENARKALRNKNPSSFKHGVAILKQIPAKEAVPLLLDLLKDKSSYTRKKAGIAIGVIAKQSNDYEAFKPALEPLRKLRSWGARRAYRIIQRLKRKQKTRKN